MVDTLLTADELIDALSFQLGDEVTERLEPGDNGREVRTTIIAVDGDRCQTRYSKKWYDRLTGGRIDRAAIYSAIRIDVDQGVALKMAAAELRKTEHGKE